MCARYVSQAYVRLGLLWNGRRLLLLYFGLVLLLGNERLCEPVGLGMLLIPPHLVSHLVRHSQLCMK